MVTKRTKILTAAITLAALVPLIELTTNSLSKLYNLIFSSPPDGVFVLCNTPDCSAKFEDFAAYLHENVGKVVDLDILYTVDSYFGPDHLCNALIEVPPINGDRDGWMYLENFHITTWQGERSPRCVLTEWIQVPKRAFRYASGSGSPATYLFSIRERFYVVRRSGILELVLEGSS
tara:strand:+ start:220 stop:747 length:528 start_codon:yes stop_codon:yes gene_type:complete